MIYITVFAIITIFTILDLFEVKIVEKKFFLLILTFFLIVLSGARYKTGSDWAPYFKYFYSDQKVGQSYFEIGYQVLNFVIRIIFHEYTVMLFAIAIFIFFIHDSVKRATELYFLTFMGIFGNIYFVFLGGNRQAIALALIIFSVHFIIDRKKWLFFLTILLATSFHLSSLLFLPSYFLANYYFSTSIISVSMICFLIIGFADQIGLLEKIATIFKINLLLAYLKAGQIDENLNYGSRNMILIIEKVFFLFMFLKYRPLFEKKVKNFNFYLNLTCMGYGLFFVFVNSVRMLAGRGSLYFRFPEVVLISSIIFITEERTTRIFLYIMVIVYFLLRLIVTAFSVDYFLPYQTYLFK